METDLTLEDQVAYENIMGVDADLDQGDDVEDDEEKPTRHDMFDMDDDLFGITESNDYLAQAEELVALHNHALEYGMTPDLVSVISRRELLAGTSMEAYSLESLDSGIALEGILGAVKDKVKAWAATAMEKLKSGTSAIVSKLASMMAKLKAFSSKIGTKINTTVKAHPYATMAAAVAAIGAVAGVILLASSRVSESDPPDSVKHMCDQVKKGAADIKWPFGKIKESDKGITYEAHLSKEETIGGASTYTTDKLKGLIDSAMKHLGQCSDAMKKFVVSMGANIKSMAIYAGRAAFKAGLIATKHVLFTPVNNILRAAGPSGVFFASVYVSLVLRAIIMLFSKIVKVAVAGLVGLKNLIFGGADAPLVAE